MFDSRIKHALPAIALTNAIAILATAVVTVSVCNNRSEIKKMKAYLAGIDHTIKLPGATRELLDLTKEIGFFTEEDSRRYIPR